MRGIRLKKNPYILFTILFLILVPCIYATFYVNGKSFLWITDGYYQHWMAYTYYGDWLRDILHNLIENHSLAIREYDYSLGFGSGIIPTLHYYCIGDPLCLTSIFVSKEHSMLAYGSLIFVRMYLSGMTFVFFARYTGRKGIGVLLGAISYVFCGYVLFAAVRHPFFINAMITFPMLLYGVECIIRQKKLGRFAFFVALAIVSNFYFAYMQGIFVCIYALVRIFFLSDENNLKASFCNLGSILFSGLVGIAVSSMILVPMICAFIESGRGDYPIQHNTLYSLYYYVRLLTSFLISEGTGNWVHIGVSVSEFFCIIVVFVIYITEKKNKDRGLNMLFLALCTTLVFFLIPVFGSVFNGGGYVANRWEWLFEFVASYTLTFVWERIWELDRKQILAAVIGSGIYVVLMFVFDQGVDENGFASVALLMMLTLAILFGVYEPEYRGFVTIAVVLITCFHVCANGHYLYDIKEHDYVDEFENKETVWEDIDEDSSSVISKVQKNNDSFTRYENISEKLVENAELLTGANTTSFYWSLNNNSIAEYFKDMGLCKWSPWHYYGVEGRTFLAATASVKYAYNEEDSNGLMYGYEPFKGKNNIYENQYTLPIAYTYETFLTEKKYNNMETYEKQEELLNSAVLSDEDRQNIINSYDIGESEISHTSETVASKIDVGKGIKFNKDGSFTVRKENAKMKISFNGLPDCETYLSIKNLDVKYHFPYEYEEYIDEDEVRDVELLSEKIDAIYENMDHTDLDWNEKYTSFLIKAKGKNIRSSLAFFTPYNRHYVGQSDYLMNLGYHKEAITKITLVFPDTGVYSFDEMKVVCQPVEKYTDCIGERKVDSWENENIVSNGLSGDITAAGDRLLMFSVPYNVGWKAYVDGKETPIYKTNKMYQSIAIHKGVHHIVLKYSTPGLKLGAYISLFGILLLLVMCFWDIKQERCSL